MRGPQHLYSNRTAKRCRTLYDGRDLDAFRVADGRNVETGPSNRWRSRGRVPRHLFVLPVGRYGTMTISGTGHRLFLPCMALHTSSYRRSMQHMGR